MKSKVFNHLLGWFGHSRFGPDRPEGDFFGIFDLHFVGHGFSGSTCYQEHGSQICVSYHNVGVTRLSMSHHG